MIKVTLEVSSKVNFGLGKRPCAGLARMSSDCVHRSLLTFFGINKQGCKHAAYIDPVVSSDYPLLSSKYIFIASVSGASTLPSH